MKSDNYQLAEQSGNEFLTGLLRKDSGGAITPAEVATYGAIYLPRPGDSSQVLEQKRSARNRATIAVEAGMPAAAILSQERALRIDKKGSEVTKPEDNSTPVAPAGAFDVQKMSDEELRALINGQ
jgi:hypothetical protein